MKYVEGTSLAKHPRGDARSEVAGLVDVVRAVHYAHQHGVLHRDLKPSNVLVDPRGTRFVTDFGLAKRLSDTDRSLTDPGQVLGTPRYMAPEQAAGRKDLTVSADVYSLGVILYERLTGRTPFTGDNVLTLLRQARESEPPRPSTILPGMDRDLETVVLKCLDKEPSRRYASAEALADDLDRWLKGEPIQARPVGQAERLALWCRRNPVVSGLTAAVAASLLIGIVVSTYFAVQASRRAIAESRERALRSRRRKEHGGTPRAALRTPSTPIGRAASRRAPRLGRSGNSPGSATRASASDSWTRPPAIRLRAEQLRTRSEPALIAAIGLDPEKRVHGSRLLAERVFDSTLNLKQKCDIALLALELEDWPGIASEKYSKIIIEALAEEQVEQTRQAWERHVWEFFPRLDQSVAIPLLDAVVVRDPDPPYGQLLKIDSLGDTSSVQGKTRRFCGQAIRVLDALHHRFSFLSDFPPGALVTYLEKPLLRQGPDTAARIIFEVLADNAKAGFREELARALIRVVEGVDPTNAAHLLEDLLSLTPDDQNSVTTFSESILTVADRMQPNEAALTHAKLARLFTVKIDKGNTKEGVSWIWPILGSLRKRNHQAVVVKTWSPVIRAVSLRIEKEIDPALLGEFAVGFGPMVDLMGVDESARTCGAVAEKLAAAFDKPISYNAEDSLFVGLAAMAIRLPADRAVPITRMLAVRAKQIDERHKREGQRFIWRSRSMMGGSSGLSDRFYSFAGSLDSRDSARAAYSRGKHRARDGCQSALVVGGGPGKDGKEHGPCRVDCNLRPLREGNGRTRVRAE